MTQEDLYKALHDCRAEIATRLDAKELVKKNDDGTETYRRIIPEDIANQILSYVNSILDICIYIDHNFTATTQCVSGYIENQKFPESYDAFFEDYSHKVSEMAAMANSQVTVPSDDENNTTEDNKSKSQQRREDIQSDKDCVKNS